MEPLYTALNAVKMLRSSVGQVFDSLGNGLRHDHGEEGKDSKFLIELQELLTTVSLNLREVEQAVASLTPPPGPFNLGNTTYLSQESTQDRQALYVQFIQTHKWMDKLHEYCNNAHSMLSKNTLRRSNTSASGNKRRRTIASSHNVPPQTVDGVIATIDRMFPDMNMTLNRPFASNAVLQITLGQILKAQMAFKGLMIEWVVVKAYTETPDLWTESRYKVFRKVTENAHSAMLHYYSPTVPDLAVRSFMTWFHSYIAMFSDPCKRCGNHLYNNLPPTWRDFRSLEPFHEECRP